MPPIDLKKIEECLEKSGFVLEHRVTEKLKRDRWSVINNKYYLDDVQETVNKINTFYLFCKKNECLRHAHTERDCKDWLTLDTCIKNLISTVFEFNNWSRNFRNNNGGQNG